MNTTFRDKYLNHHLRSYPIHSWSPETGIVPLFEKDIHELMVAGAHLATEGLNLVAACDDGEEAQMIRMYNETGFMISPSFIKSL